MNKEAAEAINVLGRFCGVRDVDTLEPGILMERYGLGQADVFVLFGGSILAGGDVIAQAIRSRIARKYIIVGGAGHTTETLRQAAHREYPEFDTAGLPEAEVFQRFLKEKYGLTADYLETRSTNCGNNITNLLGLIKEKELECSSMILCQDATMQRRMSAGLEKYALEGLIRINYATYAATVGIHEGSLYFLEDIHGMWSMDRYVNLLMGEIPRLRDDENGYGPKGKGFIAHVEIPEEVTEAFDLLKTIYGENIRTANPAYAS